MELAARSLVKRYPGAVAPDDGRLEVDGRPVSLGSPHAAHALGIRMIHQELSLVPELTVAENIFLGAEPARRGVVDRARQARDTRAVLETLGQRNIAPNA